MAYVLILLPAALGFLYVHLYGVNVPYNDEWTLVPLFEKLSSGTLTVADLFAQHYEHRIFFPRIAMLLLGAITSFNTVATMYLIQTFLLVTLAVLLLAFRSSVSPNPFFFVPVAFLVFSWGQSWNMLQGFQIQLVFVQTFGVLAFWLLHISRSSRLGKLAFTGALGSATVAAFSSAHGLVVWPVGLMQLLFLPIRLAERFLLAGVWALVGLLEWIVYFLGYEHTDKTEVGHAMDHPWRSLKFFLTALGGSLFKQPDLAFSSGILLVFLVATGMVLVYKDGRWGECSFWIAILSFSLLILTGTTLARGMSIENASNPKYVTYSVPAPIAVYAMLVGSIHTRREPFTRVALAGMLLALIVSSVPLSYAWGVAEAKEIQAKKEKTAFVLATYHSQPDRVLSSKGFFKERFRTNPEADRERAAVLERLEYSVFSERWPRVLPPPLHALSPARSHGGPSAGALAAADAVQIRPRDRSGAVLEGKSFVKVTGWAVDAEAKDTAGGVYVVIDGKPFPTLYGTKKKEVAERLGAPAYEHSGFWRAIPVSEIEPGTHELSLIVVTSDEEGYYRFDQEIAVEVS